MFEIQSECLKCSLNEESQKYNPIGFKTNILKYFFSFVITNDFFIAIDLICYLLNNYIKNKVDYNA